MNLIHTKGMRKALAAVVASSAIFSLSLPITSAFADATPSPSSTATPLSPFEQYRIDRENFFDAMKTLTLNFKIACDKANSNYATAVAIAKSKDQKRTARLARDSAITTAAVEFENAKNELGPMPVEPMRSAKAPSKNKTKQR
jgi:hypothetical protein